MMIPYKGKVTLEKTIKNIEQEYSKKLNINEFNNLLFRLTEEEISEILYKLLTNDIGLSYITDIEKHCEILNISLVSNENKNILFELIDLYSKDYTFPNLDYLEKLFNSFNDKKLGVEYLRYLIVTKNISDNSILNLFIDYLIKARQYYVDDRALLSSAISLIESINDLEIMFDNEENLKKLIDRKILNDKKANGIYDIDEYTLEEFDRKLTEFEEIRNQLENLVGITEVQINELKEEVKKNNDNISNIKIQTLKTLKIEANKIISDFNKNYLELLTKEKESIINEKDLLMADVQTEINKKKLELEALAANVGQRIAIELGRIRQQSDYSIEQMQSFVNNNEEVKKMFEVAKTDQAFMSAVEKISAMPTPTAVQQQYMPNIQTSPNIIIPSEERKVNEKVNYYFDKTVPFKDRFNEIMLKKQENIEKNGTIYHEKFDDFVVVALNDGAPYLYGPSGCGKSFMVENQFAKLIGIDVITNGYIMYESDILGFNNANGVYVPSNFYRCYKYGDIIFLDELDNSISSSTIALNSFLGKKEGSAYTFPNGDRVKKHSNFRIITAGNTRGNGKSVSHNTRQKLDESVMQRLTPIEIDYDNRIEEKILERYPDWYNFSINFRKALKEIKLDGSDGPNYNGTITTRDIESIKRYKDDDSFSDEKIIEYEVIENKDIDYLNEIIREMDKLADNNEFTKGGVELLGKFKKLSKGRKY